MTVNIIISWNVINPISKNVFALKTSVGDEAFQLNYFKKLYSKKIPYSKNMSLVVNLQNTLRQQSSFLLSYRC